MRILLPLLGLILLAGCVKIETGPASREERTESARATARDTEVEWKLRFDQAPEVGRLDVLRLVIDSVAANYHRYGSRIAEEWQKAEEGRRQPVPAGEMLTQVEKWNELEAPVLRAYENVIEYGVDLIKRDRVFDPGIMQMMESYRDQFYELYNAVFFPAGTVDDYARGVDGTLTALQRQSRDLDREATRYR